MIYPTVAAFQAATVSFPDNTMIYIHNYYAGVDGGGHWCRIKSSVPSHKAYHESANGISRAAFDLVVTEEVSSQAVYERKYRRVFEYPGEQSGPTGGIGYDFGTASYSRATRGQVDIPGMSRSMSSPITTCRAISRCSSATVPAQLASARTAGACCGRSPSTATPPAVRLGSLSGLRIDGQITWLEDFVPAEGVALQPGRIRVEYPRNRIFNNDLEIDLHQFVAPLLSASRCAASSA